MNQASKNTDTVLDNTNQEIKAEEIEETVTKKNKAIKIIHPKRFIKGLQTKLQRSQYLYLLFCFFVPVVIMYGI